MERTDLNSCPVPLASSLLLWAWPTAVTSRISILVLENILNFSCGQTFESAITFSFSLFAFFHVGIGEPKVPTTWDLVLFSIRGDIQFLGFTLGVNTAAARCSAQEGKPRRARQAHLLRTQKINPLSDSHPTKTLWGSLFTHYGLKLPLQLILPHTQKTLLPVIFGGISYLFLLFLSISSCCHFLKFLTISRLLIIMAPIKFSSALIISFQRFFSTVHGNSDVEWELNTIPCILLLSF